MKKKNDLVTGIENQWLAEKLKEKYEQSGCSMRGWFDALNIGGCGSTHYYHILSGKRGLTFAKAVRMATAAGLDLSELQKIVRKKNK